MKHTFIPLLLLVFAHASFAQLSGPLSGSLGPGTYHIIGDISVQDSDSLTLIPGTVFHFDSLYEFHIYGTLLAEGIESDSIVFTTDTLANPDCWRGLRFDGSGSSGSRLAYCLIEKGYARGGWPNNCGGGVFCYYSSPTFTNCTLSENSADHGGGVYCYDNSSPSFANCTVSGNSAAYYGGGVYCWNDSSPTLTNCTLSGNSALCGGGVSCWDNSSPSFTNCTMNGNSATHYGGGVSCWDNSSPSFTNCTMNGNSATYYGGGVSCYNSSPEFNNCTMNYNSSTYSGGGVYCCHYSSPTFSSCIISDDSTSEYGGGVDCDDHSSPYFRDCCISNNLAHWAFARGGGISCRGSSSPYFANCRVSGNMAIHTTCGSEGGGLYCADNSSPVLESCVISNNITGHYGGGISCSDNSCSASFTNCVIDSNSTTVRSSEGGGVECGGSSSFTNCSISHNSSAGAAGGARAYRSATFMNCTFIGNSGGGVDCAGASLIDCSIIGNAGYGVFCCWLATLTGCRIIRNSGYGVCLRDSATVNRCTISNNLGYGVICTGVDPQSFSGSLNSCVVSFSAGAGVIFENFVDQTISYCNIFENSGGTFVGNVPTGLGQIVTTNINDDSCDAHFNIFLDPMFVDTAAGDYHLTANSPCIDAGDPLLPRDPDFTVADIGAFFYDHGYRPPSPFHLLAPQSGDTCWDLDTLLVWQAAIDTNAGDTVSYEVWLDTLANLATAAQVASALSDTIYSLQGLLDDHAYYSTVHASDLNSPGTWAIDTLMFHTYLPEPPSSFALAVPENGDTVYTATPTLRWRMAVDPDPGDTIRYRLMWSYAADFSVYEDTTLSDTSFTFPPELLFLRSPAGGKMESPLRVWRPTTANNKAGRLDEVEDDSTIYWKVEALDRFGLMAWCEPAEGWSFHVFVEQPPNAFNLLSPANGDTLDSLTALFIWEETTDPDPDDSVAFYRVYLAFDSLFSTGLDSQDVTAAELLWGSLADDQTYWWRVKAFDGFGASTFSNQTWSFSTYFCEIPEPFSLLQPADSSQLPFGEVNFCWQAARDPDPADTVNYMLCFVAGEIAFAIPMGLDTCGIVDVGALELPDTLIEWWVTAHSVCPDDTIESTSHFHFYPPRLAISGTAISMPTEFALHPNFPNPFNPVTVIRYDVKERGFVSVEVFDLLGRKVATLVHGAIPAGFHAVTWNASNLPSGLYFCRMEAANFMTTRKMLLVK